MKALPLIALVLLALTACNGEAERQAALATGGDPGRGRAVIVHFGCASCHTIPGIRGADAQVGPSLDKFAGRSYVGGVTLNTPENLMDWIKDPPGIDPKTAMPNLNVTPDDARDIAAYLYTLR